MANQLQAALRARDPYGVGVALELPHIAPSKSGEKLRPHHATLRDSGHDWSQVASSLLNAKAAARAGDAKKCYEAQSALHSSLNHLFASYSGNWLIPALHVACKHTHFVAVACSTQKDQSQMQNAVNLLQESFSRCLNDRTEYQPNAALSDEGSKKAGVLYIVNQLFAMYFRLNTLRLCKNIVRPVESRKLHMSGLMGDMVKYRYYVGRLCMFEDHYDEAEINLDYALLHCRRSAPGNKRRILQYLVPVKMLRGRLPTKSLLEKYNLTEFMSLVEGLRKGDLQSFNAGLQQNQDLFIRRGIYLLLEKCKTVCYRNLLKRVHLILKEADKPHLNLSAIDTALRWLNIRMDLDEIECILANLIYRGYIRGYISHTKRVLVLSKTNAFPTNAVILGKR